MRQYLTRTIFAAGRRHYPPGSAITLSEGDAEIHLRQGTIEPVKDAETLRREALWAEIKAAALRDEMDRALVAAAELLTAPEPAPKPAPEPPTAPPAAAPAPSGKPRG